MIKNFYLKNDRKMKTQKNLICRRHVFILTRISIIWQGHKIKKPCFILKASTA